MDKREIKDIIRDIGDDYDNQLASDFANPNEHLFKSTGPHSFNYAAWEVLMPNVLGFLLGCAVLRQFGGGGLWYFLAGSIGYFSLGVVHCMIMRKMDARTALIRNGFLLLLVAVPTLAVTAFFLIKGV